MQILNSLWSPDDSLASFVIWELRLPRFILAFFVGAALGMAGAIIQSITRNPIGSPSLMGGDFWCGLCDYFKYSGS